MGASIIALFFVPAGLMSFGFGLADWLKQWRFLKKAHKTTGTVIGIVGARVKTTQIGGGTAGMSATGNAMQMATGTMKTAESSSQSGFFIRVEYAVGDYVYTGRSKQTFDSIPENQEVEVFYNPDKPQDAAVEGYYVSNSMYYQMIAGGIGALVPVVYYLLS